MLIIVNVIITIIARNVLILNNFECNNRKYTLVFSKAVVPLVLSRQIIHRIKISTDLSSTIYII